MTWLLATINFQRSKRLLIPRIAESCYTITRPPGGIFVSYMSDLNYSIYVSNMVESGEVEGNQGVRTLAMLVIKATYISSIKIEKRLPFISDCVQPDIFSGAESVLYTIRRVLFAGSLEDSLLVSSPCLIRP